jgi:hypothetical protein
MRAILVIGLISAALLAVPETHYEQAEMTAVQPMSWVSLMGSWDKEGKPTITDIAFTTHYNRNAFGEHSNANQIWFKGKSGKEWHYGINVAQSSHGTERIWTAHAPGTKDVYYTSYRLAGPGLKDVPGKLECDTSGAPKIEIWEEAAGKFRWEVKDAWQVLGMVSYNEGESWTPLDPGNQGRADLKIPAGAEAVVRFQAYKGLRGYVDVFINFGKTPGSAGETADV